MQRTGLALLGALVACPAWVQAAPTEVPGEIQIAPGAEDFTLPNGLQVVVIPDHRAPVVTHMIWYRVGSADETAGQSGIAHFLEHLMFKGTAAHPGNELDARVNAIGGDQNAYTSSDYTVYFQRVARENLGEMMSFEADRMTNLVLTDEIVAPERDVVINERLETVEADPSEVLGEGLLRLLYLNHPYGRPVIGWQHEIRALDRQTALSFYKRYYTPNNAVLLIAGDVTPSAARLLAEGTYGKVPARPDAVRAPRPAEPPAMGSRSIVVRDENVGEPQMRRAYIVPSVISAAPGEAEALSLLAKILGGGSTSRAYDQLVRGDGVATEARAFYEAYGVDSARFIIYGAPKPGTTLATLDARLSDVLADLQENGVTSEELQRAKRSVIAEMVYDYDDQERLADGIGEALIVGQSLEDVKQWPARIRAVKAEAVQAVARKYLQPDASVTGYLEPPAPD